VTSDYLDSISLSFVQLGRGSPVVVLHGFAGSAAAMFGVTDALAPHHEVMTIDLVGHGRSPKPEGAAHYEHERVVEALDDVIVDTGLARTHLLGYSMGGRIALSYAVAHRDRLRSVVLVSASAGIADATLRAKRRRDDEALADRIEQEGLGWFVDYWMRLPLLQPRSELGASLSARARSQRMDNDPHALANVLRGLGPGVLPSALDHLDDLDLPVAVIAGEHDMRYRAVAADLVGRLHRGVHHVVPDAGHAPQLDNPTGLAAAVLPFLRDVDAGVGA
jgi:2-succinyl-6-hydroxy-2,4-cyclohexadiene-1-carboxylate synthase